MSYKKRTLTIANTASTVSDIIPSTLAEDFASFSFQLSGTFVATAQFQGSNDNVTWYALRAQSVTDATVLSGALSAAGIYRGLLGVRYIKVACSAYTSGAITATVLLHPDALPTMVKST